MYFLQRLPFKKLNSKTQPKAKRGEQVVSRMDKIDMESKWLIIEIYNYLHVQMKNFTTWVKEVQSIIQGYTRIPKWTITDFKRFNSSLYLVVIIDNILLRSNVPNSTHLECRLPYMVVYGECQNIIEHLRKRQAKKEWELSQKSQEGPSPSKSVTRKKEQDSKTDSMEEETLHHRKRR